MKVLNVNHLLDAESGGGTAERTFQLSRFLAKSGVDCTVLALDIGVTPCRIEALEGARVVALPCLNRRYFVPRVSFSALDRLVAGADIVHLSGHWTLLNALVYRASRKQGKPYAFCPAGALKSFGRSLALKRRYDTWVGRDLARSAAACIAITEEELADFEAYSVASDRVTIIPNGIDPAQYRRTAKEEAQIRFAARFGLGTFPYILFLGRLNEIKGPDLLLTAFSRIAARFPAMHLVFAGPDGGMLESLRSTAKAANLADKVHFTGYVSGEDKSIVLNAADLMAIPSRHEAMSIVVLEAGACGAPVMFTDTCGLNNIAAIGAGTMVQASAGALAEGLVAMLSDAAAMRAAGMRLAALVEREYQWKTQAERYISLYESLLGSPAR
jgi:glycosyltransferase involved in cell wall biosynthesis